MINFIEEKEMEKLRRVILLVLTVLLLTGAAFTADAEEKAPEEENITETEETSDEAPAETPSEPEEVIPEITETPVPEEVQPSEESITEEAEEIPEENIAEEAEQPAEETAEPEEPVQPVEETVTETENLNAVNEVFEEEKKVIAVTGLAVKQKWLLVDTSKTAALGVSVEPLDATDPTLKYAIEDTSIAKVDAKGNVTGLKAGKTILHVSDASGKNALQIAIGVKAPSDPAYDVMFRLYNPNSGEHFYTGNRGERDALVNYGWQYEGFGWAAPIVSGEPVYRLYNTFAGDHHYTLNAGEKDALVKAGWNYEGIGWYSDEAKQVALYRQYNPYTYTGMHNFTTSVGENNALKSLGWTAEGISWYGVPAQLHENYLMNQTYYQVDEGTGEVIHAQKLMNSKVTFEGIDISVHNGDIDLTKYQNGFVIIRLSYSWKEDEKARRNMDLCEKLKIPYGVYVYSYALNAAEAEKEAEFAISLLKGRDVKLGVWFDMEDADFYKLRKNRNFYNRNLISSICQAFCRKTAAAGYHTGIYASYSWFKEFISGCDQYEKWVAHWGSNESKYEQTSEDAAMELKAAILQYACKPLDRNVMYIDPAKLDD